MDTSLFLAKVIGLYFLIMGIAMLLKGKSFKVLIHDTANHPPLVFLSGVVTLIIGILIIVSHNIWQMDWFVAITIIGWFSLIQGLIRIFFPIVAVHAMKKFLQHNGLFYTLALVIFIIGIILSYLGFMSLNT